MDRVKDFADERQFRWCIYCGEPLASRDTNWDHAPSRALLDRPFPENLPQIEVHTSCNSSLSADEEYVKVTLFCVLAGSCDPDRLLDVSIAGALRRNSSLRSKVQSTMSVHVDVYGSEISTWAPDLPAFHRILHKNARGHIYYEMAEPVFHAPLSCSVAPWIGWSQAGVDDFLSGGAAFAVWPEVGSRLMDRMATGVDLEDGWIVVQPGIYRYRILNDFRTVRIILREYLTAEIVWEN